MSEDADNNTESAHTISIDLISEVDGDNAFAAFCDGPGCSWRGDWHHADNEPGYPAPDAYDEAHARAVADGTEHLTPPTPAERLEYLRGVIAAGQISYGELSELESLAPHIAPGDVELLEWAGVPEHVADGDDVLAITVTETGTADELADVLERIAALLRDGYTSGLHPDWETTVGGVKS